MAGEREAVRPRIPRHATGRSIPTRSKIRRSPSSSSGERIDYVYAAGPSKTLDSKLVGEPGGEDVDIEAAPWTSDHRAVLSSFEVTPVEMPTLIAVDARLRTSATRSRSPTTRRDRGGNEIAIVPEGGDPADPVETLAAADERGTAKLDTAGWDPGAYEAVLTDGDGAEVARVSFYLRDPHAQLELSTDQRSYERDEPIEVSWTEAPANRWDWLGVYKADGVGPRARRLPDLGLHRRAFGRHRPADHRRQRFARRRESGRSVAASEGGLRRPLPARRPVSLRRQRRVQRSLRR